jgi:VanZ family protein
MPIHTKQIPKALLYTGLSYLAFVIYGSLVPLDYHHKNWSDAVQAFAHIRYLKLGIESRADWIANALLYIPLTFIGAAIVAQLSRERDRTIGYCSVLMFGVALSIAIEFTQVFFPQRTVSLNDIIAEIIGSAMGLALWLATGMRVSRWVADLGDSRGAGRDAALTGALSLYLLAYVAYSLFPFDFVVSYAELAERLANDQSAWLFSSVSCSSGVRCSANFLIDLLAAFPLGVVLVRVRNSDSTSCTIAALAMGTLLGILIEGAQLFLHSGVSEGLAVLSRSVGAGVGAFFYQRLLRDENWRASFTRRRLKRLALLLAPIYLMAFVTLQGMHLHDWLAWQTGWSRLTQVHFLPFYYHYFTTETAALASLLRVAVSYAPISLIVWLGRGRRSHGARLSALLAALLATATEAAKLFQLHLHPDPTDILIAGVAAAIGYELIVWVHALHSASATAPLQATAPRENRVSSNAPATASDSVGSALRGRITLPSLICIALLAFAVAHYPLGSYWLAGGALMYLVVLQRWPTGWLVAFPALLPVLDLAPWSGRFFFDEFDYLVLATIAIAGWRKPLVKSSYRLSANGFLILALLTLSTLGAALIGAYPFPPFDLNSFNNYYSHYNALRVAKGLMWALLLMPLLKAALQRDAARTSQLFVLGMTLGVLSAGLIVLWERLAFAGLLDFSSNYRVVGMFSGMHTGGAYIEGYFASALPFAAWWTVTRRTVSARLFGTAIFALGCYALMVTYARGGYVALAFSMAVLTFGLLLGRASSLKPRRVASGLLLFVLLAVIAWPVLHGSYMQGRFATTQRDLKIRTAHWTGAIEMMDDSLTAKLFGMGLGRYPETYFWRNLEGVQPASYRLVHESGNTYLALSGGDALYVEQIVNAEPNQRYHLRLAVRGRSDQAEISVPLCEKWMLYSANCSWASLHVGNTKGKWLPLSVDIDTGKFALQPWYASRTVKLALTNRVAGTSLDIDEISLKSVDGIELLQNGKFADGMDHWFFTTDNHLPWHFKNLWLQVYFEQGLVGLLVFACLLIYAFIRLAKRIGERDALAAVLAASLVGFLTVGVVDSLFDVPRMALMFYFVAIWAMLKQRRRQSSGNLNN